MERSKAMSQKTKLRRPAYRERLREFAAARIFAEVDFVWETNGRRCDACGSPAPKTLRVLEDRHGNRFMVGNNCYLNLRRACDAEWEEVKRLGRDFELWVEANDPQHHKTLWRLIELYEEQDTS
jgi:hypothetical protein